MQMCPDIPNIRHLRMAQMIGRLKGVSSAARQLNASQPAVTQAVANLEAELGAPIFDRCATGTYPTEIGEIYLRRIDRFFEILETAVHDLLGESEENQGRALPLIDRIVTGTQLRSLVVASEPATIEAAAAEMQVSPASLYRAARTLERALGKSLFSRSMHGPVCNKAGEAFARQVRRAVREIEFAMAEVTLALGTEDLEIVVGMLPMSGSSELASAVLRFTRLRPSVRIKVRTGSYLALLDDLYNCRVDMIFGVLRKPEWARDIEEELLFRDSYCVVTRPDHPLTLLAEVTPAALLDYDWIVPATGTPRRTNIDRLFEDTGILPRRNIEATSLAFARALLLDSDMVTVMTRSEVNLDESLGTVVSLPCKQLGYVTSKGVTTRAGWLPTEAHRQFLTCLRDATAQTNFGRPGRQPAIALVS